MLVWIKIRLLHYIVPRQHWQKTFGKRPKSVRLTLLPFLVALETILKMSNMLCYPAQLNFLISAIKYATVQPWSCWPPQLHENYGAQRSLKSEYGQKVTVGDGWNEAGWPYSAEMSLENINQRWKSNEKGRQGAINPAHTKQLEPHHCKITQHLSHWKGLLKSRLPCFKEPRTYPKKHKMKLIMVPVIG